MRYSRCAWRNCPQLIPSGQRYCQAHRQAHERQRGTATQRGYNASHRALRTAWARLLASGQAANCPRCGKPITARDTWDLGHTDDRTAWTGPEHAHCNRKAGQTNSTRMREHWT